MSDWVMAKNWRLAVCTRWRPLVGATLVCLTVLCTGTISYIVYTKVDEYPVRRLEKRIHRVKVGMSVAELESILGPPDSKTNRIEVQIRNEVNGVLDKIVEYGYSAYYRLSDSSIHYGGIFVDENLGRVVSILFSTNWSGLIGSDFSGDWLFLIATGLVILVILIVMLFFRRWCQSVTDAIEDN